MKKVFLPLLLLFGFQLAMYAAVPEYQVKMHNLTRPAANQLTFDVSIRATGATADFELTAFQGGFWIEDAARNGGTWTGRIVAGSSQLNAATAPTSFNITATYTSGTLKRQLRVAAKLASPGLGTIIGTEWVRIYTLACTTSVAEFAAVVPNYAFEFVNYKTIMSYNEGGISTNGTNQTYFSTTEMGSDPLPVEISKIWATAKERDITIKWQTATEVNSSKFEVERSACDKAGRASSTWTKVGEVSAAGQSNAVKEYTFVDQKLNSGKWAYRIKSIDNDGSFKHSDAVYGDITKPAVTDLQQNYPNSFNPSTKIEYQLANPSKVQMQLFSVTGEFIANLIDESQDAGYFLYYFDANKINRGLASGVYLYRMIAKDNVTNENFVKTKKMLFLK